jgi:hypothetical protein
MCSTKVSLHAVAFPAPSSATTHIGAFARHTIAASISVMGHGAGDGAPREWGACVDSS